MPSIEEFSKKRVKFKKVSFRPWKYDRSLLNGEDGSFSTTKPNNTKSVTKEELNSNQKETKRKPKGNQTATKKEPNGNQNRTKEKPKGNLKGNPKEPQNEKPQDHITDIYKLSGLQKILFFYIIERTELAGNFQTGPITLDSLITLTKTTTKTIKTALQRLIKKGLIKRSLNQNKTGKGGFRFFVVDKEIKTTALEFKRLENVPSIYNAFKSNQMVTQTVTEGIVSNSIYNKNTITVLPNKWLSIDFSSLINIGFSETQLIQIYETGNNSPEVVQESINHFAFGLENTEKTKSYKNPLNTFMGVLRKGGSWVEDQYLSPQELALQEIVQRKKEEKERIAALGKEIFKQCFEEWFSDVPDSEAEKIFFNMDRGGFHKNYDRESGRVIAFLMKYYREVFWPEKAKEYDIKDADIN